MRVFISYSHRDSQFVDRFTEDLKSAGIPASYDKWILNAGDSIIEKIVEFLCESDVVIAVLSNHSIQSRWVQKEIALAVTNEISRNNTKVIPVVIDDCKIPLSLSDKLYADFRGSYYDNLADVISAIYDDESRRISTRETPALPDIETYKRLVSVIESGSISAVKNYLYTNKTLITKREFYTEDTIHAIIPSVGFSNSESIDFLVVDGTRGCSLAPPSCRFKIISLYTLHPEDNRYTSIIEKEIERLVTLRKLLNEKQNELPSLLCAHLVRGYTRSVILDYVKETKEVHIDIEIYYGRRDAHTAQIDRYRERIYRDSGVQIISYDRLLDRWGRCLVVDGMSLTM